MSIVGNPLLLGGGKSDVFAFIVVTYPEGSTLTATKGSKVLTAGDTTGTWVFDIPEAGTWTVTATLNEKTATRNVTITEKGQSTEIGMSYRYYLIQNGVALSNPTLTRCSSRLGEECLHIGNTSNTHYFAWFEQENLTDFESVIIDFSNKHTHDPLKYGGSGIGISTEKSTPNTFSPENVYSSYTRVLNRNGEESISIDISSIVGLFYLAVDAEGTSEGDDRIWIEIKNFYLE